MKFSASGFCVKWVAQQRPMPREYPVRTGAVEVATPVNNA
jgi:hypothetical protein